MPDRGGEILGRFGISSDVEAVWLALLDAGESSIAELAQATGKTEDATAAAVSCLLAEELASQDSVDGRVRALEPTIVIQARITRAERRLVEELEALNHIRTQLPDLAKRHTRSPRVRERNSSFDVVFDEVEIRQHIYLLIDQSKDINRSMIRHTSSNSMIEAHPYSAKALERRVELRTLISAQQMADEERFRVASLDQELGDSYRSLPGLPTHMLIFDTDVVVLPLVPEDVNRGAMFVRERGVIEPMIALFDHLWSIAQPVFADKAEGQLSDRAARVLELVSAGATDDSIARALGVTVRTVRREVATLRDALGIGSRMEIVPAAVRRGWL